MIEFDDSVNAQALNPAQLFGVYYVDGSYSNESQVRGRLPKAKLIGITVTGHTKAEVCDCEKGDLTVEQTIAWVENRILEKQLLIVVYADLSTWTSEGLLSALAKYGNRIKRWVADYDNSAIVPDGYDAHQYAGNVIGENGGLIDKNVANDNFFTDYKYPAEHSSGLALVEMEVNVETGHATSIKGLKGKDVKFAGPKKEMKWTVSLEVGEGGGKWKAERIV